MLTIQEFSVFNACMHSQDNALYKSSGITEDRVKALEQRVELQEDEIMVLKSSLADVLRRLKEVEANSHNAGPRKSSPLKSGFTFLLAHCKKSFLPYGCRCAVRSNGQAAIILKDH